MPTESLSIAGTTFKHPTNGNTESVADGWYYAVPPFGNPPSEGEAEYEFDMYAFPGVDGLGGKKKGFRGRNIDAEVIYFGASLTACETAKNALLAAVDGAAARFSITLPGGTARPSCRLKQGGCTMLPMIPYYGGKVGLVLRLNFRQLALT